MSLAPARSLGAFLKARLAVNGIQCAARSFGTLTAEGRGLLSSMGGLLAVFDVMVTRAGYQLHLATETGNCEPVSDRSGLGQGRLRDRTRRSRTPRRRTPRYRAREIGFAETPPPAPAGSVRFRTIARLLMSDAVSHLSRCGG